MFSMAVAGLVKPLIAVTITLNPAAAYHGPGSYTIRPGDTLSQIAARAYGSAADWPAIWWANRRQVPHPDLITAGQRLALPSSHQVPPWLARAALAAAAAARPAPAAPAGATAALAAPAQAWSPARRLRAGFGGQKPGDCRGPGAGRGGWHPPGWVAMPATGRVLADATGRNGYPPFIENPCGLSI